MTLCMGLTLTFDQEKMLVHFKFDKGQTLFKYVVQTIIKRLREIYALTFFVENRHSDYKEPNCTVQVKGKAEL